MKKRSLYITKSGKIAIKIPAQKVKATGYQKYLNMAKEHKIPKSEILSLSEYHTAQGGERARGRKADPRTIARLQAMEGHTDKQINAIFRAAKGQTPILTKKQFIANQGWQHIDMQAAELNARLKEEMGVYNMTKGSEEYRAAMAIISSTISRQIYGSD